MKDSEQRSDRAESSRYGWFLTALPLAGAVLGPWLVGGESNLIVKSAVGFLTGAGFSGIALKGQFSPPLSTIVSAAAVTSFFSAIAVSLLRRLPIRC
jgi:hypothetical protein